MIFPSERRSPKRKYDWEYVDWSLSTEIIQDMTGAPQPAISTARRRYAPETVRRSHAKVNKMLDRYRNP